MAGQRTNLAGDDGRATRYSCSYHRAARKPLVRPIERESSSLVRLATEAAQREINLLREYRTRLIADVVTGKLDVREAASRLPDEVEEPELLDETDALTEGEEEPTDDLDAAPKEAAV